MCKIWWMCLLIWFAPLSIYSQTHLKYQQPAKEILDLATAKLPPSVVMNDDGTHMVFLYRNRYKSLATLSEKEMRLAGLRINPVTNIGSRSTFYRDVTMVMVGSKEKINIKGLPDNLRLAHFSFSPDQKVFVFTNTTLKGVELWCVDIKSATAKKLTEDTLNANMGTPYQWFADSNSLLVKFLPKNRATIIDKRSTLPAGPRISVNSGKKAQNRTYQDLLKDRIDEENFQTLVKAELHKVDLDGGKQLWLKADLYKRIYFSPSGDYVLVSTIEKPFSYLVTYNRFPSTLKLYDKEGKLIKTILKVPLIEDLPKGFMAERKGMRNVSWRLDKPATLYWAEALDEGDPAVKVKYRDQVYEQDMPDGEPRKLFKTINRFYVVYWGNDKLAIAADYWWNTRNKKTYIVDPSATDTTPKVIFDKNYQDRYNDPGNFVTAKNKFHKNVLYVKDGKLLLQGNGYSPTGIRPFIDEYSIATGKTERLWRASGKTALEMIQTPVDLEKGIFLTSVQSKSIFPNYYLRNMFEKDKKPVQITFFENPFKSIMSVHKELIKYQRDDGLDLSAVLYLPIGYEKGKKYPMLLWAYPREFKDKKSASQVTSSHHQFVYPRYSSPIFWVTRGYVVLDRTAFPIIGEKDNQPNDSFVKQLVANAKAAIDAVDTLGYIDRTRVAVGGHSYGAFMTANLLSHSNLFAAGIARSGAYNRTLTPFGFQAEERSYWEAPQIYYQMSPFMHADKMKTPLLLIHGEADNNSGTYPMQSERYFNALKGLGATVRLVMLPKESHGYRARESVLHMLWEQDSWLEKHVGKR
ncbi:alpha/beta hydrolase family protein [Candidatus Uabimicrobium amorphum]|uniref:Peptidase S9 prolyl oligopeptidase catalytic domain-containing protein n=1 Tax=Uabimicrobium amorphum TaxID=2596890 RepID=A0A5S9ISJ2_UABAM|nr:prolyl oligopeptidase family serine peptidase [Candidatus Uabimicrobium amorphum]BBM86360.1 hypothetical protein UABAM_04746 [Candidatus Uabimicrobium amorphum]